MPLSLMASIFYQNWYDFIIYYYVWGLHWHTRDFSWFYTQRSLIAVMRDHKCLANNPMSWYKRQASYMQYYLSIPELYVKEIYLSLCHNIYSLSTSIFIVWLKSNLSFLKLLWVYNPLTFNVQNCTALCTLI